MARRKKRARGAVVLTSEWLKNWAPPEREEIADAKCVGLFVRGGPRAKTFCRYTDAPSADGSGRTVRKRVTLGRWSEHGGSRSLTLDAAREAFLRSLKQDRAKADGTATVAELAERYREKLAAREHADAAWSVIRTHIVEARPDPKRPAFGEWPAAAVRARDIAAVVEHAKVQRRVPGKTRKGRDTVRRQGGKRVAAVVLRELKGIFNNAVSRGALDTSPAVVAEAKEFGLEHVKRDRWLRADELPAFFEALDLSALLDGTSKPQRVSETIRLALGFLLYVPVRSHSLTAARWEEFDLDARRWTIPVANLKLRKAKRATARPMVVPLCGTAVAILKKLQALAGESPWVLASPLDPEHPIEKKGLIRALTRLQVTKRRGRTPRLAFGSKLGVHDLRRTWRTWAGDLGVPFEVAERSLGHSLAAASNVADVYARGEMVERRAEAAELVGAAFDRIRLGSAATVVPLAERAAAT